MTKFYLVAKAKHRDFPRSRFPFQSFAWASLVCAQPAMPTARPLPRGLWESLLERTVQSRSQRTGLETQPGSRCLSLGPHEKQQKTENGGTYLCVRYCKWKNKRKFQHHVLLTDTPLFGEVLRKLCSHTGSCLDDQSPAVRTLRPELMPHKQREEPPELVLLFFCFSLLYDPFWLGQIPPHVTSVIPLVCSNW